jgi:5-methylcytosine-specific restriction endonuclease McrA
MNFVNKTKRLDKRLRIFERDNYQCYICNTQLTLIPNKDNSFPANYATLDHVKPASKGGGSNYRNLKACCYKCNTSKGCKWKTIAKATNKEKRKDIIEVNQPLLYKLLYKKEFVC